MSAKPGSPAVLLIGNFLSAAIGNRAVCEDLALGLKRAGWSVITTSSYPGRFKRIVDFLVTVWRQRDKYQVAQVDVYSGLAFIWAELVCWALRLVRKPYVLTLHGGNLPTFSQIYGKRVRRLLKSSFAVTTPSAYLFEHMRPYCESLVLLPNSLELAAYQFRPRERPAPNLVWLRAFHHIYNPMLAVRITATLAVQFPDVKLTMCGPDKDDGSLESTKELAFELGVQDRITCHGAIAKSEVPNRLHEGDIFLNTTRVDNTPISVLEAMACGLCIISTNVGGIPYLLKHESDALLVPDDDEVAMAEAVKRLLMEPGLAEKLSHNARRKVEDFDWFNIFPKWEKLLMQAALGRAA
jgi:glycosyltransferase involved in cell wall biosynthesis